MSGDRGTKRIRWGRFERDDQGRWIVRMRTFQLIASTIASVGTVFGLLLGAVSWAARPYLESITRAVVEQEMAGIDHQLQGIPSIYETRSEHEQEMLELNRKLDTIAGEIRRLDDRILTQSDRTDALMRDLMRAVRRN